MAIHEGFKVTYYDARHFLVISTGWFTALCVVCGVSQLCRFASVSVSPALWSHLFLCFDELRLRSRVRSRLNVFFKCDDCGVEPIVGVRWRCLECANNSLEIDLCDACMAKPLASRFQTEDHSNLHLFESILAPNSYYDDKDYEAVSRRNYLDPNYMPV